MKRLIYCLLLVSASLVSGAQEPEEIVRPVMSAFSIEAGGAAFRDTYLTPLKYKGWQASLSYERLQAMKFNPERWVMQLDGRLSLGRSLNPARTALMWQVDFRPSWSMMWRARLPLGFTMYAGGTASADLGVLYLPRNGNNPASAKASITIGATGMAVWNGKLGRLPLTIRYQPKIPIIGAFFSPDYDELYYEIWLGNHSGLCYCAWPGNFFRFDNLLTIDLHFGATTLRVGYRCDYFSGKAGDIVNRSIINSFVIGVSTEHISLRTGSAKTPNAKVISALY